MTISTSPLAQRRVAIIIIGAAAALLLAILVALPLVRSSHNDAAEGSEPLRVGHIHGIAVTEDRVLIGAHYGVFAVAPDGTVEAHGARRSDTMALATVGDRVLASGHPAAQDTTAPVNAGLLVSDDQAATFEEIALTGEADFHSLDGSDGRLWGLDSVSGRLLTSTDDVQWQPVAALPFIDLAADPSSDEQVFATTEEGGLVRLNLNGDFTPVPGAPLSMLVATSAERELFVIGPDGQLASSTDAGLSWKPGAAVPGGQPTALTVSTEGVYVATADGFYRADDLKSPFKRLFAIEHTS